MRRPWKRTCWALWALLSTAGCGPERSLTGIWQQEGACAESDACPAALVYELHLGRYGSRATGLLVRYLSAGEPFDSFEKVNECGCYALRSARADEAGVRFQAGLAVPGCPDPGFRFHPERCVPLLATPSCTDLAFDLRGDEDGLEGEVWCAGGPRPAGPNIRFVPVVGRPRTGCLTECEDASGEARP